MRLRILVADNSELIRRGVKMLLNGHEDISVVGEASKLRDVIRMTDELEPDVLVLDLRMTEDEDLANLKFRPAVLAMAFDDSETTLELVRQMGAATFIDKMKLGTELIPALQELGRNNKSHVGAAAV